MRAQLAKDSTKEEVFYINDENWWMEQKFNGQRFLVRADNGVITAYNRHGNEMNIPLWLLAEFTDGTFSVGQWEFDGELLASHYVMFDCMYAGAKDIRKMTLTLRREYLERIYKLWNPTSRVSLSRVARGSGSKLTMFAMLAHAKAEGAVVKNCLNQYVAGKKVNHMLKIKFVTDCDVEVMELERDGKPLAITVGCYDDNGNIVEVSGCKIPASVKLAVGDIITVNYLYATNDNKLTQPTFQCVRNDTTADTVASLKHTSEEVV